MMTRPLHAAGGDQPYFFVSYSHEESELCRSEMAWIRDAGFDLWHDEGIRIGAVWRQSLAEALGGAAGLLFFASAKSMASDHCRQELHFILDDGKPVFVVRLDATPMPDVLRLALSERQMLSREDLDEETYRRRLVAALASVVDPRTDRGQVDPAPKTASPRMPVQRVTTCVPLIRMAPLSTNDGALTDYVEAFADDLASLLSQRPFDVLQSPAGAEVDHPAAYGLTGSARRDGDGMALRLRLSGPGGAVVGGARQSTGTDPGSALATARTAATALTDAVLNAERDRVRSLPVSSLDAWALIVRAVAGSWTSSSDLDECLWLLKLAIERDPDFAFAHASYAVNLQYSMVTLLRADDASAIDEVLTHAERALTLAPNEPVVLECAAGVQRVLGSVEVAMQLAERAVEAIGASKALGLLSGPGVYWGCLVQLGRTAEVIERARDDPLVPPRMVYAACLVEKDRSGALKWARRAVAAGPNFHLARVELANALALVGETEEARRVYAQARRLDPTLTFDRIERGKRLVWRNDSRIVDPQLEGLRRIGIV